MIRVDENALVNVEIQALKGARLSCLPGEGIGCCVAFDCPGKIVFNSATSSLSWPGVMEEPDVADRPPNDL